MGGRWVLWTLGELPRRKVVAELEKYCSTESSSCSYAVAPPLMSWYLSALQGVFKLRNSAWACDYVNYMPNLCDPLPLAT